MPLISQVLRRCGGVLAALALMPAAALPAAAQSEVRSEQVRAQIVAHAPEGIAPGRDVWLGLLIEHQPHWHTYWKNPGDSGLPTSLAWTLPFGVEAGEIQWPTPQKLPVGPLMNFGYEGTLLLPVRLQIPITFAAPTLSVQLKADWLVCKEVCLPQSGRFSATLPAHSTLAMHAAKFEAAWQRLPRTPASVTAQARIEGHALQLQAQGLPADWQGRNLNFFPEQTGIIDNAAPAPQQWDGGTWSVSVPLSHLRSEAPGRLQAVLAAPEDAAGVQLDVKVAGPWPAPGTTPEPARLQEVASAPAASAATPAFGLALLLALAGGALLNLMPCVFPVLSLKLVSFASHVHDRRRLLAGGLAYTAGVVLSFLLLAGLLLALRAGGQQLGWGFQLQSPGFVAATAALFALIGLNLAGLFEFGAVLPSGVAGMRLRHPLLDSALTGVLAVAVASPCTAPFMGASLGAAATLPAPQALAVFGMLGLGMALPYLAASAWPGLARALPRPGPWMATLRHLMAYPMFAAAVWLLWVLGQQTGLDGVIALLGVLVALAFAIEALAASGLSPPLRAGLGGLALAALAAALSWALPTWRDAPPTAVAQATSVAWQPWSAQRVAELQAQGRPVFVDFTAAWCVTCQFNKRTVLGDAAVLADLGRRNVALLRADWTRRDEAIGAELARLGRSGVPVYALYPAGGGAPRLLSEVLSATEVRGALEALPGAP